MWTPLHAKIHRTIRIRRLFERHQRLLIAVSGGQDSLCLTKLMLDLQPKWEWDISICHCDHGWRTDSVANARHVENLAQSWGIKFYLETATQPLNSEVSARNWRYEVLSAIAHKHNYHCIVTGHTASDRAETLLYNLMRGSGTDGLQALKWQRRQGNISLIRPLLEITRSQTGQFCQDLQLPVWEDSTNDDLQYARNRIRHDLLPYLQKNFNPQVESALAQTAELLQAEVEYLEQAARELREEAEEWGEGGSVRGGDKERVTPLIYLNRQILQTAPLALQRRVMRQVLLKILPCAPNFEHVEKLTAIICAPNSSQTDPFPGGAIARVEHKWMYLYRE